MASLKLDAWLFRILEDETWIHPTNHKKNVEVPIWDHYKISWTDIMSPMLATIGFDGCSVGGYGF